MTDRGAAATPDRASGRLSPAPGLWLGGAAALVLGGLVLVVRSASPGVAPPTTDLAVAAPILPNPPADPTRAATPRTPPAAPAPRGPFAAETETEGDTDGEVEEVDPAQPYSNDPRGTLEPVEIVVEAKLAPRGPVSAEPLVPTEIVVEAKLAPRAPVTAEPLVPTVIEVQAELAAPRR